jgi:uncharacterized membrane protein
MATSGGSSLPIRVPAWAEPSLAFVRRAPDLVALIAMAVVGIGISVYLTSVHYAKVPLVCNTTGVIDCAAVTSSKYSLVPGTQVPITVPGLLWFVVSGALAAVALAALVRGQTEPARLRIAHLIWGALGMAFVLYLVFAEIVLLHRICEWCTVVHLMTLLTFLIVLNRFQRALAGTDAEPAAGLAAAARPSVMRQMGHDAPTTGASRAQPSTHGSPRPPRSARSGGSHGRTPAKSRHR